VKAGLSPHLSERVGAKVSGGKAEHVAEQDVPFHDLLRGHLKAGTAPRPVSGGWKVAAFAEHLGCTERTVRNWTSGDRTPEAADFEAIETALFGKGDIANPERVALRRAWEAAEARRGTPGRKAQAQPSTTEASGIPRPDRCFGRDALLGDLVAALSGGGIAAVLLLGDGGIGKTTLAREAANHPDLRARFAVRCFEARLETAVTATDFEARVAEAIGRSPTDGFAATLAALGAAPALLLLDNLETPWEAAPREIEARIGRLAAVPGLALIASLRGREAPRGARWHRRDLRPLTPADARQLFLDIAPAAAEDKLLPGFLEELAGIPLAIDLVAREVAIWDGDLAEPWARWQATGPGAIVDPRAAEAERQHSLARSIEFSLGSRRVDARGMRLFRLLGVLPAGLAKPDREALLGGEAAEAATQLLRVGLAHGADGRLDVLPPVRRHAAARHPPQGEEAAGWTVHFLGLAAGFERKMMTDGGAAIARLGPEVPNLEAAFTAAAGAEGPRAAAMSALWTYATACRFFGQGGAALRALRAACAAAGAVLGEANCVFSLAGIALARSEHEAARAGYAEALPLYRRVGAVLGEANCIEGLADIALARSEHKAARAGYEAALPLYRRVGDVLGEANCVCSLADIALARSEHEAARAGYAAALPLYRRVGAVLGEANCIKGLADIALARSEHEAARAGYAEALPLYRRVGAVLGEANCISRLADIARARSEHEAARAGYAEALPLYRRVGAVPGEADCVVGLADIPRARSEHETARAGYAEALPLYRRVGDVRGEGICLAGFGDLARDQGDVAAARGHYEAALSLFERIGAADPVANTKRRLVALDD